MENDADQQSDETQKPGVTDLRAQLKTTLVNEFRRALASAGTVVEDQRDALVALVEDDGVSSQSILKSLNPIKKEATDE
jgi:hypothetical protein